MKTMISIFLVALMSLVAKGSTNSALDVSQAWKLTSTPSVHAGDVVPSVTLKEALGLAEQYVAKENIDVSNRFLESIRLIPTKEGQAWVVTWCLKTPSDGGQVFITVKMDKSLSMIGGL